MKRGLQLVLIIGVFLILSVSVVSAQGFWCEWFGFGCSSDLGGELGSINPLSDDGLISHWEFEGDFRDSVGGNDGVNSSVVIGGGKIGSGGDFSGSRDVVTVADSASLGGMDSVSIGGWVYVDSFGSYNTIVNKRYSYLFTLDSSGRVMVWGGDWFCVGGYSFDFYRGCV